MAIDPLAEIDDLVAFEGRATGTDAERRAARHLEERLEALGREATTEPTTVHPNLAVAHALHALIAIVGSVLSVTIPAAGAALVLLAAVSAFGDLTGSFHLVRRLTGRRASQDVTSPEGGDKPGVVILTAHYDAGRRGFLQDGRLEPFFWAIFAILVCTVVRLTGFEGTGLTVIQFVPTVLLIASVPLLVDLALSRAGRGENDNASGVATVLALAERYGDRLEHFDLWVVFPSDMRGWIRRRKGVLDSATTVFVNVERVGSGGLRWVEKEGVVVAMRYHPRVVELCEEIGEQDGVRSRRTSPALSARAAGFPAISITSGHGGESVDAAALGRSYDFCCALLERLDEAIGPELA